LACAVEVLTEVDTGTGDEAIVLECWACAVKAPKAPPAPKPPPAATRTAPPVFWPNAPNAAPVVAAGAAAPKAPLVFWPLTEVDIGTGACGTCEVGTGTGDEAMYLCGTCEVGTGTGDEAM
jgi:hypothetical protein